MYVNRTDTAVQHFGSENASETGQGEAAGIIGTGSCWILKFARLREKEEYYEYKRLSGYV